MKKFLSLLLAFVMLFSLVACGDNPSDSGDGKTPVNSGDNQGDVNVPDDGGEGDASDSGVTEFEPEATYTSRQAWSEFPSFWNPHTYRESNAQDVFQYLTDSLYTIDANDELHNTGDAEPWTGYAIYPLMAADMPTDVTEEVKAAHPDWIPEGATKGYAWEIPLREDLYFDTGYHITADTYVESIKDLLDPKLQNYRAVDFYDGSSAIVGAEDYFLQGQENFQSFSAMGTTYDEYIANGGSDADVVIDIGGFWGIQTAEGKTFESITSEVEIRDPAIEEGQPEDYVSTKYLWDNYLGPNSTSGHYQAGYTNEYAGTVKKFDDNVNFEDVVGFYAKDEYTLVLVYKSSFDPGFFLFYNGINSSTGWLIEPDVYAACLSQDEAGAWHSTYMTSVETSPSYGPYSMTSYQTDKQMTFAKNESWYGWTDDVNHVYKHPDGNVYRTNQTTNIDIQMVTEDSTRLQMFLSGQLTQYGLRPADYDQYGHSDYAYDSPSETAFGLWLTGNLSGLQAREAAADFDKTKNDLETVSLVSFHKALAVSFDRQKFCDDCHPAYIPTYGMLGNLFIYDPDTGATYRDSDEGKQVLCDFYSVDTSKFDSLDEAVASITGFDLDAAKELYQAAFEESLSLGYITDADNDGICDQNITMVYSLQQANDDMTRRINYLSASVAEATVGTPFEGKLSFVGSSPQEDWLGAYQSGACDCFIVGLGGSVFDPYNAIAAFGDPNGSTFITPWYDPTSDMLTLTVNGEEITMSVTDWCHAVNGTMVNVGGKSYSFGRADVDNDVRLPIVAGIESKILAQYNMLPFACGGSRYLLTQQQYYPLDEYVNVFVGYGPTRYQYTDAEWEEYVAQQIAEHGQLQY